LKKKILILVFLLFFYCSTNTKPEMVSPDVEFEEAVKYFEEENYNKTLEYLKYFFNRYPGSHYIDDAQFYYAESFYKLEQYTEAMNEFQFLLNNFPNSSWSEIGLLRNAQCLAEIAPVPQRDQTLTKEAIDAYEDFLRKYPYSKYLDEANEGKKRCEEKINKKLLEIGETYIKMGIGRSAIIYLKRVAGQSEQWKDKANLLLGDIAYSYDNDSLASFYYLKVEGGLKERAQEKLRKLN
jgi:outer membrane protein assembly factor BamD